MKNSAAGCQPGSVRSIEGKTPSENPHARIGVHNFNLPAGAFTECDALAGISKFQKRYVLMKLGRLVRWGKLRRVNRDGVIWFVPVST